MWPLCIGMALQKVIFTIEESLIISCPTWEGVAMEEVASWLVLYDFLNLLSCTSRIICPGMALSTQPWALPLSIIIQEHASQTYTQANCSRQFLKWGSSSQVRLTYVKMTKLTHVGTKSTSYYQTLERQRYNASEKIQRHAKGRKGWGMFAPKGQAAQKLRKIMATRFHI